MTRPVQNPSITAALSSSAPKNASGWYRTPVTVTFTCIPHSAKLQDGCPAPVQLTKSAGGQSVTRTITAADGGTATVTVSGIDIDRTPPSQQLTGVRTGATFVATPTCRATATVSGIASCHLTSRVISHQALSALYSYRAVALDRAGNRRVVTGWYRLLTAVFTGAPYRQNAFTVHAGRTYSLVVSDSAARPVYYEPVVAPKTPAQQGRKFSGAGPRRWSLRVSLPKSLSSHRLWNTGIKIDGVLHILRIRVA